MSAVSVDNQYEWRTVGYERPSSLEIVLLKRTYVLPWSQFLYAEGGEDEVRLVFATHDVYVKGSRLGSLLTEFAAQRVARLSAPTRADRLEAVSGRVIRELAVERAGEHRA